MKKKKWRDIRNALVMTLVMVAMMSTATYAWFTLSSSPTVTGMEMVAASTGGLVVSDQANGVYYNAMELPQANWNQVDAETLLRLVPVSPKGEGFALPVYTDGTVTGLENTVMTGENLKGNVAVYEYYIKSEAGVADVGIIVGDPEQGTASEVNAANQALSKGTFVRQKTDSTDTALADATGAIRMGLVVSEVDGTNPSSLIIYEPNNNVSYDGTGSSAASTYNYDDVTFPIAVTSNEDGVITGGTKGTTGGTTSEKLFEVGEDPKKVTMYIWLEGTDADCIDQIKADQIEAQIQFTAEPVTP
ncbi:MAG: hypothetical protein IJ485_05365 [Lachnospiraceae bacterium]|nr:hypothetical protein [Lachnospiraceae bacterium]